jgi:hypothetical protein
VKGSGLTGGCEGGCGSGGRGGRRVRRVRPRRVLASGGWMRRGRGHFGAVERDKHRGPAG